MNLQALKDANAHRWANMHLNAAKLPIFKHTAQRLIDPAAKARYEHVSSVTGVPWHAIAVQHEREASQNWHTQLAQGDPLNRPSIHVPRGEGPYSTWEEGAIYALVHHFPWGVKPVDWSVGGTLTYLEGYNGPGYFNRGLPSPYIWAGTDQYRSGKYTSDGHFDPSAVDQQLGCAGLIAMMMALDSSIKIEGAVAA